MRNTDLCVGIFHLSHSHLERCHSDVLLLVGNSIGIFPPVLRDAVCAQVRGLLAKNGVFIAGFW